MGSGWCRGGTRKSDSSSVDFGRGGAAPGPWYGAAISEPKTGGRSSLASRTATDAGRPQEAGRGYRTLQRAAPATGSAGGRNKCSSAGRTRRAGTVASSPAGWQIPYQTAGDHKRPYHKLIGKSQPDGLAQVLVAPSTRVIAQRSPIEQLQSCSAMGHQPAAYRAGERQAELDICRAASAV